eukprot:GGOE01036851.1.p1 GENE.GGOE01036851.1~~GGOE01036851.1.p1  ORF type:complete len:378 (+),score=114.62 GGOE01036851.1:36-1169(+)
MVDFLSFCGRNVEGTEEVELTPTEDDAFLEALLAKTETPLKPLTEKVIPQPQLPVTDICMTRRDPPFVSPPGINVFGVSFSDDGQFLAGAYADGEVRVFNVAKGSVAYRLQVNIKHTPVTAVRFRPDRDDKKNILVAGGGQGELQLWHVTSRRCLFKTVEGGDGSASSTGTAVYALDFKKGALFLATAGMDKCVRVYDELKHVVVHEFRSDDLEGTTGHSNRIYAVKWHNEDPNVLLSGGWDRTVRVWDIRQPTGGAVIFGPYLSGQSLDVKGSTVLVGCDAAEAQLALYDLRKCQRQRTIPVPDPDAHIFACEFLAVPSHTVAVAGSRGLACVLDYEKGSVSGQEECAGSAWSCSGRDGVVAFGGMGGAILCLQNS